MGNGWSACDSWLSPAPRTGPLLSASSLQGEGVLPTPSSWGPGVKGQRPWPTRILEEGEVVCGDLSDIFVCGGQEDMLLGDLLGLLWGGGFGSTQVIAEGVRRRRRLMAVLSLPRCPFHAVPPALFLPLFLPVHHSLGSSPPPVYPSEAN